MLGWDEVKDLFGFDDENLDKAFDELEEDWDGWLEIWHKKGMPEGLKAAQIVWWDFPRQVERLIEEKFPDRKGDPVFKAKVAVTIDMQVQ